MTWLILLIGAWIGFTVGWVACALCVTAKQVAHSQENDQ